MSELVRFLGDGQKALWPLPFTPAGPEEISVSIIRPGMAEMSLLAGRDFSLQGNVLICLVQADAVLIVRKREAAASAAYGAAPASAPAAALAYETAAEPMTLAEAGDDLEARYQALSARLQKEAADALDKALAAIASQMKAALETALAAVAEQGRKGVEDRALAAAPLGQRERITLERGAEAGAYITLPVWFFPGSALLLVWLDGALLALNKDYEEIGPRNESSNLIRLLRSVSPGAALDLAVLPAPSSQRAESSAKEAKEAQRQAAVMLAQARDSQTQAVSTQAAAADELTLAMGWAKAAEKSAEDAWSASRAVFDAAAQVSIHARRPGVCAVKSKEDIHACSPGLFIINPHLTHAPTPFFGVWPAPCVHEMKWDGVFFMGGQCYPDDPALPPKLPPRPLPLKPATGDGDDWIPCDHSHLMPPRPCPPPPVCPGCGKAGERAEG